MFTEAGGRLEVRGLKIVYLNTSMRSETFWVLDSRHLPFRLQSQPCPREAKA